VVLTLIEHHGGRPDELSLQALAVARRRAAEEPVAALLVGGRHAPAQLGPHGVATAHVAEDDRLDAYAPGAWARAVLDAIERTRPSAVLAAGTNRGNEVMAHVAARLDQLYGRNDLLKLRSDILMPLF
jgi:electron transfer flavoprotein alpha subunit